MAQNSIKLFTYFSEQQPSLFCRVTTDPAALLEEAAFYWKSFQE